MVLGWHVQKFLTLRSPRSGRLEGRRLVLQPFEMPMSVRTIRFTLNGGAVEATIPPHLSLIELLR